MSLQFILGNSGSGKSYTLYRRLIEESRRHPEQSFMVIVPEQFTMQTQKDLVMLHPDRGIMNIDILSFRRLAHRIFEEVGTDRRSVLTETGKNLMLRKVAMEQKDALQVLGSRMSRPGYVSEVKSMLSELMQYEITDFEMQEMMEFTRGRPFLHAKLADLRLLYRAFQEYQQDRFMKPEELMDVLCQAAPDSELLRRSTLAFDGFTGFTPSQMNVLRELLALCPRIWVTVTIDARESFYGTIKEHELFALSKKMIRTVSEAAYRTTVIEEPIVLGREKLPRFREGGMLCHLEQNLFRRERRVYSPAQGAGAGSLPQTACVGSGSPRVQAGAVDESHMQTACAGAGSPRVRAGAVDGFHPQTACAGAGSPVQQDGAGSSERSAEISMHISATPAQEVHFAARTISRLVREKGYRYQDIAVITGSMSTYGNYVKKIFPMYEVPAFLDETRHILLNPCLEFVRGAMAAAEKDFSCETVFRCLRTGMFDVTADETDRLENYVLAAGIRGRSRWEQEWSWRPGSMTQQELARCNQYRERAVRQLLPFAQKMRQKDAVLRSYAEALYELLEACGVQQKLKDRELALEACGAREEAREYSQIYAILIALLDEMVDLLGEETVSGSEFAEILDAGFAEAKVGIIPPGIDQVQVGDIERSRLAHVKVLFFLGLNDGWVPSRGDGGGIVSDLERELLQGSGIELAPTARENSYTQRFYLYQNLTKPQDHLYLSWCMGSGDGAALRPSYLVSVIRRLFPGLVPVREQEAGSSLSQVTSKENGLLYLTQGLQRLREGERDPEWMELYAAYLRDGQYQERVRELVRAAFANGAQQSLSYYTSKELYGESMTASVTRLEQFASCAFAHFAAYGLRLSERELYGIRAVDLGVIFHRAMELFSRRLQEEGRSWTEISAEEQETLMGECVDTVAEDYGAGVLQGSARENYTMRRIRRILCRSVWAMQEQLRAGQFQPAGFEVSFADAGDLEAVHVRFGESGTIRLKGRIDRIDTAQTDDAVYVKIVDYKSGTTRFDPVSLYYGLQLQLVVYLNAALEMERSLHDGREVVPAGIFYYHLDDPVLEREEDASDPQMQEKLLKKLRPDGLINSDGTVLRMLDAQLGADSRVIPAGLKKDGTLKAASSAATTEQFEQLSGFVARKMNAMAEEILQGAVEARPYEDGTHCACDFCEYADVCGFDRRIPGMCRKRLPELSKEEVWERIAEEIPGGEAAAGLKEEIREKNAEGAEKMEGRTWQ